MYSHTHTPDGVVRLIIELVLWKSFVFVRWRYNPQQNTICLTNPCCKIHKFSVSSKDPHTEEWPVYEAVIHNIVKSRQILVKSLLPKYTIHIIIIYNKQQSEVIAFNSIK